MKNILLLFLLVSSQCSAQTYDEWVRQNKTQKKYLLEQIVALRTYLGYAAEGYSIANQGLNTIKDIKNGDFSLHDNFFKSLSSVNPQVKKYSKVAIIIAMQISIAKLVRNTIKQCTNGKQFTVIELDYLQKVFDNLLDDCAKNLDVLIAIITDGEQQMKDDERIKRIDLLYTDMQDKQTFVQSFSNSAKGLSIQRRNEQYDIQIHRKLNGLR